MTDRTPTSLADTAWQEQRACTEADYRLFFLEGNERSYAKARKICGRCPVTDQCLNYALDNSIGFGYWGGASPEERVAILRRRRPRRGASSR